MRLVPTLFAFTVLLGVAGCDDGHDHDPEAFATFQECYDDHHTEEALPVQESIVICCLEHPIAGVAPVCGDTTAACMTYLGTNLSSTSASQGEVDASCADYITQKGM